jgi:hypothetical protein
MPSSPVPVPADSGFLTVDQLIEQLQQQAAHGRGGFRIRTYLTGGPQRQSYAVAMVAGLPDEMGDTVGVYSIRLTD